MAREIVITSVPRGVKLGRTGFQVAMQTAGIRDDVAAALEKMAGYRHLPAGGANPICYFHRIARTVAGQLHVIGRTVDAGVDFSNRSNKLAHMVVIEPGELGAVAQSSPAAALAAVEPRLATVWTAGPEERQAPFGLDGIPPSLPAVCTAWQQAMGDAGWAGVIAERALQKQPTLIVGTDSSPDSCRRMLGLFREALAIVPANRRWEITFDTTTLSADGVLWRGTYAGSPESQSTQPGLLVIDLARPQPIPANMTVGELVQAARTGRGPSAPTPAAPVGQGGSGAPVTPVGPVAPGVPGRPAKRPGLTQKPGEQTPEWDDGPRGPSTGPTPPPPPDDDLDVPDDGPEETPGKVGRILAVVIPLIVLLLVGLAAVGGVVAWQATAPGRAFAKIQAYARDSKAHPKPEAEDIRLALRFAPDSPDAKKVEDHHKFLTAVLASEEVTAKEVASADDLRGLLDAIAALTNESWAKKKIPYGSFGVSLDETAAKLLVEMHPEAFIDYREFHDWAVACRDLAVLATTEPADRGNRQVEPVLWAELVAKAKAKAKADGKEPPDFTKARPEFSAKVKEDDLKSLASLVAAVDRYAPTAKQPEPMPEKPGPEQTAGGGEKPATPAPMPEAQKPPEAPKDPAAAFQALQAAMEAFKKEGRAAWPPDQAKGLELFSIPADLTDDLDVDVVVGKREGFQPTVARDGPGLDWKINLDSDCLATLTIEGGKVVLCRGDAPDQVWTDNETHLRSMPIAFKRQNVPLGADCFVPSTPTMRLKAIDTLHDLLCGDEGTSKKPEPATPLADATATFRLRTGRIEIAGSPLALAVVPLADNRFALTFTAEVAGKPFTLTEPMSFDPATGQLTRERGPWTEREARLKRFPATTTTELELAKMGIKPAKAAAVGWTFEPINSLNINRPIIVRAVLSDIGMLGAPETMLEAWVPGSSKPAKGGKEDKNPSLGEWQASIQTYVASMDHTFGKEKGDIYEQKKPKPADPGKFSEPDRKKDEKDKDYNDRVAQARREYEAKKVPWDKWHAERDKECRAAAADREQLRQFLVARPLPADADPKKPDPERAAIQFILELDSLIIAKTHREELEALLTRVPVAALVEGDATAAGWSLNDGEGPLSVTAPAARLLSADVTPATKKRPAPTPAPDGPTDPDIDDGQNGGSTPAAGAAP